MIQHKLLEQPVSVVSGEGRSKPKHPRLDTGSFSAYQNALLVSQIFSEHIQPLLMLNLSDATLLLTQENVHQHVQSQSVLVHRFAISGSNFHTLTYRILDIVHGAFHTSMEMFQYVIYNTYKIEDYYL